jgi:hypothetical protein
MESGGMEKDVKGRRTVRGDEGEVTKGAVWCEYSHACQKCHNETHYFV